MAGVKELTASIITVGDELLVGQEVDTNATYLAAELTRIGVTVSYSLTVGDDRNSIKSAIEQGIHRSRLTFVTGGLGPTPDDLTREAAAEFAGSTLETDKGTIAHVTRHFESLGRKVPDGSERVALVPDGFDVLPNEKGTAPGLWYQEPNNNNLILLPGVPHEMKAIFSNHVIPRLNQMEGHAQIAQHTLKIAGIGETILQRQIEEISHLLDPELKVAYLPGIYGVRIRLTIRGGNATDRLESSVQEIKHKLGSAIFGCENDRMESVLGNLLLRYGLTIAVAESCTGGLLLHQLTNVSGASSYVLGGVVSYCNFSKQHQLGVSANILQDFGAVSKLVAVQMAEGVRMRLNSDIGLSVTGVAGPGGGTDEKPVGLVWIGYADSTDAWAIRHQFGRDRDRNKQKSALAAMNLVRQELLKRNESTS